MEISDQSRASGAQFGLTPENQPNWLPFNESTKFSYDSSLNLARLYAKDNRPAEAEHNYQEALDTANRFDLPRIHARQAEVEKTVPKTDQDWSKLKKDRAFLQEGADIPVGIRLEYAQFELSHLRPEKATPLLNEVAKLQPTGNGELQQLTIEAQHEKDALAKHPALLADGADLKKIMDKLWSALDTDKNGYLSAKELDDAIHNPAFNGANAQVVAALSQDFNDLSTINNSPWFSNPGISRQDIDRLDYVRTHEKEVLAEHDALWQVDGGILSYAFGWNQHLDRKDLDDRLASKGDKPLSDWQRDTLKTMSAHWSEISTSWGYLDKDKADNLVKKLGDQIDTVHKIDQQIEDNHRELIFNSKDLYSNAADPTKSVVSEAVRSGGDKDANCRTALSWLAATKPDAVVKMIKHNNDGTYTVTFPNATSEPITVTPPTDAELLTRKYGSENGEWAPILEKAYDSYVAQHFYRYRVNLFDKPIWQF